MSLRKTSNVDEEYPKPNILHVIQSTSGGGAEYVARQVAAHQTEHFEVSFLTWENEDDYVVPAGVHHIKCRKKGRSFWGAIGLSWQIRAAIRGQSIDCVIAHMPYSALVVWLASLFLGLRFKIFVHHSSNSKPPVNTPNWMMRSIYKSFKVVAVSEDSAHSLLQAVKKTSITVLPNPLELPLAPKRAVQLPFVERSRFIAVGRLASVKNYPYMFEALALLKSQFQLIILGEGDNTELAKKAGQLGISDKITFLGWVDPKEIESHLEASDVFLMTSNYEGEPSALLEAAAFGLFVVGRPTPGLAKAVRKAGGFYPDEDTPEAFAQTLSMVMKLKNVDVKDRSWVELHKPAKASHEYCKLIDEGLQLPK